MADPGAAAPALVPDEKFPATWEGGHALIIEFGDEEFLARCQCGYPIGEVIRPSGSLDSYQMPWERHVMRATGVAS